MFIPFSGSKSKHDGFAIFPLVKDGCDGVDVALYDVPAETGVASDGSF